MRHFARPAIACFVLLASVMLLNSCGKHEADIAHSINSPAGGTQPALDSSAQGKSVQITDKNHRLTLKPKVGTTQRYHITTTSNQASEVNDQLFGNNQMKKSTKNTTDYYLRETVRAIKPDSSVDFTFRIDSVRFNVQQDTFKLAYSSNKPSDRKDPRFTEYNVIVGQDFGVIVSRLGEILEIYGLQTMMASVMKELPDSMKTDRYKEVTNHQLQILLNQYVGITLTHFPEKNIAKDTTWSLRVETNLPVSQAVQFPIVAESKETVRDFEDHGGVVLAVLDAVSSQKPIQTSFEQAGVKASLNDFISQATAVTHIEDGSGLLVKRTAKTKQSYVYTLESKQQPGKMAKSSLNSTEETEVDLLQ